MNLVFWRMKIVSLSIASACRLTVAFVWLYHGLVPKLLGPHEQEILMNLSVGLSRDGAVLLAKVSGGAEITIGLLVLFFLA